MDKNKTILVVDDSILSLKTNHEMLKLLGYKSVSAQGGEQAIEVLNGNNEIYMLITDFNMPFIKGDKLAVYFKKEYNNGLKVKPVLMITANGKGVKDKYECIDEALGKPVNFDEFESAVEKLYNSIK